MKNFNWNDDDFLEDETPYEINPYDLKFPVILQVNNNLKKYIDNKSWPLSMYNLIGYSHEVKSIKKLGKEDMYYISNKNTFYYIPFDCMEL